MDDDADAGRSDARVSTSTRAAAVAFVVAGTLVELVVIARRPQFTTAFRGFLMSIAGLKLLFAWRYWHRSPTATAMLLLCQAYAAVLALVTVRSDVVLRLGLAGAAMASIVLLVAGSADLPTVRLPSTLPRQAAAAYGPDSEDDLP